MLKRALFIIFRALKLKRPGYVRLNRPFPGQKGQLTSRDKSRGFLIKSRKQYFNKKYFNIKMKYTT